MIKGRPAVPAPPHGTHQRYVSRYFKCRCGECKEGNRLYMEDYRERRRNNGGQPLRTDRRRSAPQGITRHSTQFTNSDLSMTNPEFDNFRRG